MKHVIFPLFLFSFLLTSCGTGQAERVAEEYHEKLKAGEYGYICDQLIDEEELTSEGRETWMDLFQLVGSWGEIKRIDQESDWHTQYKDDLTIVHLTYFFQFTEVSAYERIILVDRGDGFKVGSLIYNSDRSALPKSHY